MEYGLSPVNTNGRDHTVHCEAERAYNVYMKQVVSFHANPGNLDGQLNGISHFFMHVCCERMIARLLPAVNESVIPIPGLQVFYMGTQGMCNSEALVLRKAIPITGCKQPIVSLAAVESPLLQQPENIMNRRSCDVRANFDCITAEQRHDWLRFGKTYFRKRRKF
jgi:hypothetical protein